jgi:hypothetical protein
MDVSWESGASSGASAPPPVDNSLDQYYKNVPGTWASAGTKTSGNYDKVRLQLRCLKQPLGNAALLNSRGAVDLYVLDFKSGKAVAHGAIADINRAKDVRKCPMYIGLGASTCKSIAFGDFTEYRIRAINVPGGDTASIFNSALDEARNECSGNGRSERSKSVSDRESLLRTNSAGSDHHILGTEAMTLLPPRHV